MTSIVIQLGVPAAAGHVRVWDKKEPCRPLVVILLLLLLPVLGELRRTLRALGYPTISHLSFLSLCLMYYPVICQALHR